MKCKASERGEISMDRDFGQVRVRCWFEHRREKFLSKHLHDNFIDFGDGNFLNLNFFCFVLVTKAQPSKLLVTLKYAAEHLRKLSVDCDP
jgi:hypothetical protein